MNGRFIPFLFMVIVLAACKKEKDGQPSPPVPVVAPEIVSYKFKGQSPVINLSATERKIEARFPATLLSGNGLIAEYQLTTGANVTVDGLLQSSGITTNNFDRELSYQVKNTAGTINTWKVLATNNSYSYDWELGCFVSKEKSNDRPYEWYYDQGITGIYSSVNCGPSSVTAAIKWADQSFSHPPEYARNFYGTSGGWWFTNDIMAYLNQHSIPQAALALGTTPALTWDKIIRQVDQGRVVILCLDMHLVRSAASENHGRVNKFYSTTPSWGHFVVVKGYREVDNMKYYEIYDPFTFGKRNSDDNTLKGRGRFYRYDDIYMATSHWWNFAITVNPKGVVIDPGTFRMALDPATIPNAKGR
ncbi:MAG TPA: C39 family peptidase [Chitinophagaceae bacterium]|jgi:hypothetical protein|nr:C39 family peptidase [Chitinophagaceae bacterium]